MAVIGFQTHHWQKTAFTSSCGHLDGGWRFVYHVTSIDLKISLLVHSRAGIVPGEKEASSFYGICGQLEQFGFLVMTYQCPVPRRKGTRRKWTWLSGTTDGGGASLGGRHEGEPIAKAQMQERWLAFREGTFWEDDIQTAASPTQAWKSSCYV